MDIKSSLDLDLWVWDMIFSQIYQNSLPMVSNIYVRQNLINVTLPFIIWATKSFLSERLILFEYCDTHSGWTRGRVSRVLFITWAFIFVTFEHVHTSVIFICLAFSYKRTYASMEFLTWYSYSFECRALCSYLMSYSYYLRVMWEYSYNYVSRHKCYRSVFYLIDFIVNRLGL